MESGELGSCTTRPPVLPPPPRLGGLLFFECSAILRAKVHAEGSAAGGSLRVPCPGVGPKRSGMQLGRRCRRL